MNSTKTNKEKIEKVIKSDLQRGRQLLGEDGHQHRVENLLEWRKWSGMLNQAEMGLWQTEEMKEICQEGDRLDDL